MKDSITYSKSGSTIYDGSSAVEFFRLIAIAQILEFYDQWGIIRVQGWTPTALLTKATEITGKTYKRGRHAQAAADLRAMAEHIRASLPVVTE
jgi:hypothetical protein